MDTRLVIYTDSLAQSHVHTFKAAALRLKNDYQRINGKTDFIFARSGKDIVEVINRQRNNSIISLDIVSHGNQGGIHIARKLTPPIESGFIQKRAHTVIRGQTDKPQNEEEASMIEESMHGLYTNWITRKGVSYYYNQSINNSTDTRNLSDINYEKFAENAFVEFHGCRTAEIIPIMNSYFKDNFAKEFSDNLKNKAIVVGHITNSNPNGNASDYRHGKIRAYRGGNLIHDGVERRNLKFHNSSTPSNKL